MNDDGVDIDDVGDVDERFSCSGQNNPKHKMSSMASVPSPNSFVVLLRTITVSIAHNSRDM